MNDIYGQNFFNEYIVEDYWPSHSLEDYQINDLVKDSLGYIWLGTSKGLIRFDGLHYISINQVLKQDLSIETSIDKLFISSSNEITFLTNEILYKFNVFNGSLYVFDFPQKTKIKHFKYVKDELWVLYDINDKTYLQNYNDISSKVQILQKNIFSFDKIDNTVFLIGNELFILDLKSKKTELFYNKKINKGTLKINQNGFVYFVNSQNELIKKTINNIDTAIELLDSIKAFEVIDQYSFWILSLNRRMAIWQMGLDSIQVVPLRKGRVAQSDSGVNNIKVKKCEDGSIWLIQNNQLTSFSNENSIFQKRYVAINPRGDNAKINQILAPKESELLYALSIIKGVTIIDKNKNKILRYILPSNGEEFFPFYWINVEGTLFISALDGLYKFDIINETLNKVLDPKIVNGIKRPKSRFNLSHAVTSDGFIWFGTKNNIIIGYDTHKDISVSLILDNNLTKNEGKNVIYDLMVTDNDKLVVVSDYGLYYLDMQNLKFKFCNKIWPNLRIKGDYQISSINELPHERLFITTFGGGFYIYEKENDTIIKIDGFGLENFDVSDVFVDKFNNYWAPSKKGLFYYNTEKNVYKVFDKKYNLPKNSYRYFYLNQGDDGFMYFGVINGYYRFDPEDFLQTPIEKVDIQEIFVNDKPLNKSFYPMNNKAIDLNYSQNNIEFVFGGPNNSIDFSRQIVYKMDGWDSEWSNAKNKNKIQYNNLKPGNYSFFAKYAIDESEEFSYIDINISKPFWLSWWFYFGLFSLLSTTGYLIYLYRIKKIRKASEQQNKLEKQIADLKMKSLKAQMNPHFIFNTLNSIKSFMVMNEPKLAGKFLTKFSHLIRAILNNTKTDKISLDEELKTLQYYIDLEKLRFKNKFDYHIVVDDDVNVYNVEIPPMLIQPFVENAIWHGLLHKGIKGNLAIKISFMNDLIKVVIEDDGIGRHAAEKIKSKSVVKHKSLGLSITKDRLEILNSIYNDISHVEIIDLFDSSGKARGTQVILFISHS